MPLLMGRNWQLQELMAEWSKVYAAIDSILGNTFTQLPFGDPRYGQPTATTFTGRRKHSTGLAPTWTWSEAPSAFDTPLDLTLAASYQGLIPFARLNGSNEEADTPDVAFWSRNDGGGEGFSLALWVRPTIATGVHMLFSKHDNNTNKEYQIYQTAAALQMDMADQSAGVAPEINQASVFVANQWHFICITYDGTGGATAMTGAELYKNGVIYASPTRTENANYVAMENLAATVGLGQRQASNYFQGDFAGGPCGVIFEQAEWTAAQVANLYLVTRGPMGV